MSETWKDSGDELPRFGRKAKAWLRRRIRAMLFDAPDDGGNFRCRVTNSEWDEYNVDALLDIYLEEPLSYVGWHDDDQYHGGRFSNGSWSIDKDAITGIFVEHVRRLDRERDAGCFPTLDAWLEADRAGELWYQGDAGGLSRIDDEARRAIKRQSLQRKMSKVCPCGARFVARKRNAVHCETCREAKRAAAAVRKKLEEF